MTRASLIVLTLGILGAGAARADDSSDTSASNDPAVANTQDPARAAVSPISIVSGNGVKVGESSTIYPVFGVESGFVSNVFYTDQAPVSAGLLRVLGELGFGSISDRRITEETSPNTAIEPDVPVEHGAFEFKADLYAAYNQYLSGNDNVLDQGGLEGGAVLRGVINPNQTFFISILDHYDRLIRPTNFESSANINRDVNTLTIRANYQPAGRKLGGYLYYMHVLDLFEADTQQFADRFNNTFGFRLSYQWLPLTRAYVDVSEGVFGGIGSSSEKVSSYPLTAVAGLMTALSLNLTVNARVGYQNGFYATGPSYSAVVGGVQVGYRYSPMGRVQFLYSYEHHDSINANFYRDHAFQIVLQQDVKPFLIFARPELRLRQYEGLLPDIMSTMPVRTDVIFAATVGARYSFRDWLAATLEYNVVSDQTDFTYSVNGQPQPDPSYVRHEVMAGLRAAL